MDDEGAAIRTILARSFAFLGTAMADYVIDLQDHCEQAEVAAQWILGAEIDFSAPQAVQDQVEAFCRQAKTNIKAGKKGTGK